MTSAGPQGASNDRAAGAERTNGAGPGASPWRRWRVLVAGLVVWCALAVVMLSIAREPVEAELDAAAADILARTGESWASARFEGRDATLEGEALAEEARIKVRASLEGLFGVRVVQDRTTLLPERRPFTFSAIKDGRAIALDGYVPSVDSLRRIGAIARSGGDVVTGLDRLVRARGAPPGDFAALVAFGLTQLKKLPSGRITLSDGAIAIEGRALDLASYDALAEIMHGPLPDGMTLARFAVRPPVASPFYWSAVRDGGMLRLSGFVPSAPARAEVAAALSSVITGIGIKDDTRLADGAPSTELWLKAVRFAGLLLAQLPGGRVTLSDSSIAVEGAAPGFSAFDRISALRKAPPEGFQITRFAVEPPRAVPFTWRLDRTAEAVRLTGFAPSDEARRLLVDAARTTFSGAQVTDEMRLASGGPAPELWVSAAGFAVTQLAKLRAGAAEISGTQVTLSGEALDSAAYLSIQQAVKAPPQGVVATAAAVKPPTISPYVFSVRREGSELTVSGFYPDMAAHDALKAVLERDFLREKVNDVSAVGAGAPEGFVGAALAGLGQLSRMGAGELSLVDAQLRLSGAILVPGAAIDVENELRRSVRPPFVIETALEATPAGPSVDAGTCGKLVGELLGRGTIRFAIGSAEIDRRSRGLIDRLVFTLKRCPSAVVRISGHTDGMGDGEFNQRLSEARAAAVLAYLVNAGIPADRLSSAGFGAGQPVAPNDTEAGKALNRRIEFEVKEHAP
ncbi:OmpA family protein [Xanthobacter dioxanivorans]|uniref:OmpA family protein n=1 Tax=Xanthobacter dioxanivorans TaxID=2528964 RepID=A0A974PL61_9HYPH|nr:OmpA family protein [Xanthobacter dioxanivorans]QRG05209.1 OmpA family protein [Xanthobacter dioxanivorans]